MQTNKQILTDLREMFSGTTPLWGQGMYDHYSKVEGDICHCIMGGIRRVAKISPTSPEACGVAKELVRLMPDDFIEITLALFKAQDPLFPKEGITLDDVRTGAAESHYPEIYHDLVVQWNDVPGRLVGEVTELLDQAIAA